MLALCRFDDCFKTSHARVGRSKHGYYNISQLNGANAGNISETGAAINQYEMIAIRHCLS